jgi:hypothetical protein
LRIDHEGHGYAVLLREFVREDTQVFLGLDAGRLAKTASRYFVAELPGLGIEPAGR